jgi:hypothetical protein
VAFQRHAMNNLPVAAVVFTVQDAHSHFATATVTVPTIDPTQGDQSPVIEYIGSVSTSSFTQSDLLTANFRVYPWVGDETSVSDSSDATVLGSVTSGTCQANEQVKQATTNATAFLDNLPLGTNAPSMIIGQIVSQTSTPTSTNIWTGQTSGCQYTPTAVPATINAQPSPLAAPQYYINDPGSTYGTAVAVVDGSLNIPGTNTSGTCVAGEKMTQQTSSAIGYLISATGANSSGPMLLGQIVSGTLSGVATRTWTGGTSGCVFTQAVFTATTNVNTSVSNGLDANSCAVAESTYSQGTTPGGGACATIHGGAVKMAAFNNSTYTRNDVAGTMYLKQGYYNWTGATGTVSSTTANVWATITTFQSVTKSQVVIDQASGAFSFGAQCTSGSTSCSTPIHPKGVTFNIATSPATGVFDTTSYLWLDNTSITNNGNPTFYRVSQYYITQGQLPSVAGGLIPFSSATSDGPALLRGTDLTGLAGGGVNYYTMLGCINTSINAGLIFSNESASVTHTSTQPIMAFNKLYRVSVGSNIVVSSLNTTNGIIGGVFAQNVFENNAANEAVEVLRIAADTSTATPINNVMIWNNVIAGGRLNYSYDDTSSTVVLRNAWSTVGNLIDSDATKTDTFPTANAARVGNWSTLYGAGNRQSWAAQLSGGTTGWAPAGNYFPEFSGITSYMPAWSAMNTNGTSTTNPINGSTNTTINYFSYNSRSAYDGTNANAGEGDYRVLSNSKVVNSIPATQGVLPFDLAGIVRDNTGHGCGGAYECTTTPSQVFSW